ncbi:unannotated protein [freshwater metagenome]|uniref:Unannotated protein n=1 Tax=freshwater metagenome TaxID=449393 RepID=A0A6J7AUA2_9ZZZZ
MVGGTRTRQLRRRLAIDTPTDTPTDACRDCRRPGRGGVGRGTLQRRRRWVSTIDVERASPFDVPVLL